MTPTFPLQSLATAVVLAVSVSSTVLDSSLKGMGLEEGNPAVCDNRDELGGHDAKCTKPVTGGQVSFLLHLML